MKRYTIILLAVLCSFGCQLHKKAIAEANLSVHKTESTPLEFKDTTRQLNFLIIGAVVCVGIGVGLAVWAPLERTTGFAICCGATATAITACCLKLTFAHPVVLCILIAIAVCGLMYCVYENWLKERPSTFPLQKSPKTG